MLNTEFSCDPAVTFLGKDPKEILNSLVSSGKISQQDLNFAQQKANELKDQFEEFRSMFGF